MQEITQVLAPLKIPVSHPPYNGKATQYVVYTLINNAYSNWASGRAFQEETVYSVDLFSKANYKALAASIKQLLRAAGYVVTEGPEVYESDTQFYHVTFDVTGWDLVGAYAPEDPEDQEDEDG